METELSYHNINSFNSNRTARRQGEARDLSTDYIPYSTISCAIEYSIDIGLPQVEYDNISEDVIAPETSTIADSSSASRQPKSNTDDNSTPYVTSESSIEQTASKTLVENAVISDIERLSCPKLILQESNEGRSWLQENAILMPSLITTFVAPADDNTDGIVNDALVNIQNDSAEQSEDMATSMDNNIMMSLTSSKAKSNVHEVAFPPMEQLYQHINASNSSAKIYEQVQLTDDGHQEGVNLSAFEPQATADLHHLMPSGRNKEISQSDASPVSLDKTRETCVNVEREPNNGSSRALIKFSQQSPRANQKLYAAATAIPDHLDISYADDSSSSLDDVIELEELDEHAAFQRMVAAKIDQALHMSSMINWALAKEEEEPLEDCNFSASFSRGYKAGDESGYQDGRADGYEYGEEAGHQAGEAAGYEAGEAAGYKAGKVAGYEAGEEDGFEAGHTAGLEQARDSKEDMDQEIYEGGFAVGREEGYGAGYDSGFAAGSASTTYNEGRAGSSDADSSELADE